MEAKLFANFQRAGLSGILECPRHDEPEITKGASF
jgi:hypothetical protein